MVTEVARGGYDALFAPREGGSLYGYDYSGLKERQPSETETDMGALQAGSVSITPLRLPQAAQIGRGLREALVSGRTTGV